MKCSPGFGAFLALIVPAIAPAEELPKAWFTDPAAARQAAEKSGRPILVVFRCTH
jgi:hypothetical protein